MAPMDRARKKAIDSRFNPHRRHRPGDNPEACEEGGEFGIIEILAHLMHSGQRRY